MKKLALILIAFISTPVFAFSGPWESYIGCYITVMENGVLATAPTNQIGRISVSENPNYTTLSGEAYHTLNISLASLTNPGQVVEFVALLDSAEIRTSSTQLQLQTHVTKINVKTATADKLWQYESLIQNVALLRPRPDQVMVQWQASSMPRGLESRYSFALASTPCLN